MQDFYYPDGKEIIVQLTQSAWDYASGKENQDAQASYFAETLPIITALPGVAGRIFRFSLL